ncbi:MAG TPA: hypothetical protein ENJ49_01175 [Candidatus Moranbacteria bacterium]|nr:hypothetical protein [Candidatus Moranbacteria bacterium]
MNNNIEKQPSENQKMPKILWVLDFADEESFEGKVKQERLFFKDKTKNLKELTGKICRKIIGKENWLSDREYNELFELVERVLVKINKTIREAGLLREQDDVNRVVDDVPDGWAGKVGKINERILKDFS